MNDAVLEVLKEIREEARQTNARLDQTNARLDQTNARLESMDSHMESMDSHMESMDSHMESMDSRLESMDSHLESVDSRVGSLEGRVDFLERRVSKGLGDLKDGFEELARKQAESEMRLATEVVGLAMATREVRDLLRDKLDDHEMVIGHEHRLNALEKSTRK